MTEIKHHYLKILQSQNFPSLEGKCPYPGTTSFKKENCVSMCVCVCV